MEPAEEASLDPALIAEIEGIVEKAMEENQVPGMAVGVVLDGDLIYAKGFGVANLESGEPVTPETLFLWAEGSFAPTAMAVTQLAEEGLLDLDAPITDYLPYFRLADGRYADITARHILEHRSGLADSGSAMADWPNFLPQYDDEAAERYIRAMADQRLLFAPGQGMEFSDAAYTILGDVIAKVSGQNFEAYMKEHVLSPLGMAQSSFLLDEIDANLLASPMSWRGISGYRQTSTPTTDHLVRQTICSAMWWIWRGSPKLRLNRYGKMAPKRLLLISPLAMPTPLR